jgi:hypothetical protein
MDTSAALPRQSRWLLLSGMALFVYSSFDGFAIPYLGSPRIGLSVHTLSALQGIILLTQGLFVVQVETWRDRVMGRVLVCAPWSVRHPRRLYHRRNLGRRKRDHPADGRTSSRALPRERFSRDVYQNPCVFVRPDRFYMVGARALGAS